MRTIGVAVLLLLSGPAFAAPPRTPPRPPADAPEPEGFDLFGGYSRTRSGEAGMNGWQLSASLPLRRPLRGRLRFVADISGHYGSFAGADLSQVTVLVGARMTWNRERRLRPFGQALLGGIRTTTSVDVDGESLSTRTTGWGGGFGGGVSYRLSRRWGVRGTGDLLLLRSGGAWETDPRVSVGAVYRFGH